MFLIPIMGLVGGYYALSAVDDVAAAAESAVWRVLRIVAAVVLLGAGAAIVLWKTDLLPTWAAKIGSFFVRFGG
jgi:hypothetical protein